MNRSNFSLVILFVLFGFAFTSCTKDGDDPKDNPTTVSDTTAVLVSYNPTGSYTYFSFEKGATIIGTNVDQTNEWDFGLRFVNFSVNGGSNRIGNGGAIIVDGLFDDIKEAPETGYKVDSDTEFAINDEWYTYNSSTHSFAPKAGKIFIFKTGKGLYAKMEMLSAIPTDDNGTIVIPPSLPTKIKYTFRYTFQANGSRSF